MSIRINQRLREGYNPDGAPGTISTGVSGAPGRAPTPEEIAAAVNAYLTENPATIEQVASSTAENNRFGAGANGPAAGGRGQPGSYVNIGSGGTLHGFVSAEGTPAVVNLYLQSKGSIVANNDFVAMGKVEVEGGLRYRGSTGAFIDVGARLDTLAAQIGDSGVVPDFVAQFEAALV